MSKTRRSAAGDENTYDDACELLRSVLSGGARAEILGQIGRSGDFREALRILRTSMRSHAFRAASGVVTFGEIVKALDGRTRQDGFRILHAWDPEAHRFTTDTNPVLMLDYVARTAATRAEPRTLAILLDCYFLYLLALLAMRVWDQESPGDALDRVTALIGELQGPRGSGYQFVADAETLLLLATSQYQPDEPAYDRLLERIRTLDEPHRLRLARVAAANLGSHLRWGYQLMYRRDPEVMRADNVVDYPWLLFSLATLMRGYSRMVEAGDDEENRERVVEALLNGWSADPTAFTGEPPGCLAEHREEHAYLAGALRSHRATLRQEFQRHRPPERSYSPIAFQFNFLHNTLVAKIAVSLLYSTAPNLPLNALFTREEAGTSVAESPELLARMLMEFSGGDPSRLGARGAVLVVYDPSAARQSVDSALHTLESLS